MELHSITLSWASCVQTRRVGLAGKSHYLAPSRSSHPFHRVEVLFTDNLYLFIEDTKLDLTSLQLTKAFYTDSTGVHDLPVKTPTKKQSRRRRRMITLQGNPSVPFALTVHFENQDQRFTFEESYSGTHATCLVPWRTVTS